MRTIEEIKGNCIVELDADGEEAHWIWQGAFAKASRGTAKVWAPDRSRGGKMRVLSVPAALWQMVHERALRRDKIMRQMCGEEGCVRLECWRAMSRAEYGEWQKRTGFLAGRPVYFISNKKTWDTRGRKISDSQVEEIRLSEKTGAQLALELGTKSQHHINNIKRGAARQRAALGMFTGLLR